MSYMKSLALQCDSCFWWTDFGLPQPTTVATLLSTAKRRGWECSATRRNPMDLCPKCMDKIVTFAAQKVGETLQQETPK